MQKSEFLKPLEERILVVDDDPELCNLLQDILSNYEVDTLQDGSQVAAQLAGQSYQILISDLHMPGLSGMELLKALKPHYPELEILLLTGGGSVETAVEAMKLGASEFLLKPVRVAELREAVSRAGVRLQQGRENRVLKQLFLKQKSLDEMRERFVTLINHELRTPLTTLRFVAEELAEQVGENEVLSEIFRSSLESLELLSEDMCCLSERSDAYIPLQDQLFQPSQLLQNLLGEMRSKLGKRELTLTYEGEEDFEWQGDPRRLRQIASELISNSIRATADGGTIRVATMLEDRSLILEVVDNGVGIPKEKIPTIFEPFQTLGSVETHHSSEHEYLGGGLGVGLSIIRDVIERMGGAIGIVSDSGEGCIVDVRLEENAAKLQIEKASRILAETELEDLDLTEAPRQLKQSEAAPPQDGESRSEENKSDSPLDKIISL